MTVTNPGNSATGSGTFSDPLPDPPLDAATATWTCTPSAGSSCGGANGSGTGRPPAWPITVAPNGGTVTFAITVTIRPSEMAVMVDNVGSVTPGAGTACVDGQPTCDGEDTFTATPETAPLTITKDQNPTTPAQGGAITYTVVVTNPSAFTTAHAMFDDPVPAQIVADGGWTTATTGAGTTATPASAATGFPAGVSLVIAPGGTVTFTITAHVSAPYDGTQVTNTATATPGLNTACADGRTTCQAEASFANPAQLDGGEDPCTHRSRPARGPTGHLHGDGDQPGQQRHRFGHILRPPAGSAARRRGRHLDMHPQRPGQAVGRHRHGIASALPITVAPNGGTVTFTITATIRPSGEPVTVHNVGSVTPGPGTACEDGQPTCDAEDTFTATPKPAPLTITKTQSPTGHTGAG